MASPVSVVCTSVSISSNGDFDTVSHPGNQDEDFQPEVLYENISPQGWVKLSKKIKEDSHIPLRRLRYLPNSQQVVEIEMTETAAHAGVYTTINNQFVLQEAQANPAVPGASRLRGFTTPAVLVAGGAAKQPDGTWMPADILHGPPFVDHRNTLTHYPLILEVGGDHTWSSLIQDAETWLDPATSVQAVVLVKFYPRRNAHPNIPGNGPFHMMVAHCPIPNPLNMGQVPHYSTPLAPAIEFGNAGVHPQHPSPGSIAPGLPNFQLTIPTDLVYGNSIILLANPAAPWAANNFNIDLFPIQQGILQDLS